MLQSEKKLKQNIIIHAILEFVYVTGGKILIRGLNKSKNVTNLGAVSHKSVVGIVDLLKLDRIAALVGVRFECALAEGALNGALLGVVAAELLAAQDGAVLLELGLAQHLVVLRILSRHPRSFYSSSSSFCSF